MTSFESLSKSKYLKKEAITEDGMLVTIQAVKKEDLAMAGQKADLNWVLYFEEDVKPMVCNITNCRRVARINGSGDIEDWPGTKVVIYFDPDVEFAGKITGGLRIRAPKKPQFKPEPAEDVNSVQDIVDETVDGFDEIPF